MITSGMMSSETDEWATPQALFNALDATFHFTLDVCATPDNAKCFKFFTKEQDGLKQDWGGRLYGATLRMAGRLANGYNDVQSTGEWQLC